MGATLILLGLGPGARAQLTAEAERWLTGDTPVLLRTRRHPLIEEWPLAERWPSCDDLYDAATDFTTLYAAIVDRLRQALTGGAGPIVYAVPGHPLFAEATVRTVLAAGLPTQIVPGLSLVDAVAAAIQRDPIAEAWQLLDALDLLQVEAAEPFGGGQLPYLPLRPALVTQVYSRRVASGVKLALMRLLPDDHPVTLIQAAGVAGRERVLTLPLFELDHADEHSNHLSSLYVPAQAPLTAVRVPQTLAYITARLRAPDGCPWDREQTHHSLVPNVIEEAYEVVEAIESDDPAALCEELGDLLLQVALHAQLAEEAGEFRLEEVVEAITTKLIRRHPHVFGDQSASSSTEVLQSWEQIKAAERQAKGDAAAPPSPFAGIPRALPALSQAAAVQRRAERARQSTTPAAASLTVIMAALSGATAATEAIERQTQLGQALFAIVTLARQLGVDAEAALRTASADFQRVHTQPSATRPAQLD